MRLGFVVNPVAGMGGRVGLKGTDGVAEEAVRRGAKPMSPARAIEFLEALKRDSDGGKRLEFVTCRGSMGEDELEQVGLRIHEILAIPTKRSEAGAQKTSGEDTKAAVRSFVAGKVELVVFVGGDGTARDVLDALEEVRFSGGSRSTSADEEGGGSSPNTPPALGVPSGVKMYSAVFALNPADAAQIVSLYAEGKSQVTDLEVVDIDEYAFRNDELSIRLYGYMKCLYVPSMSQASKELSPDLTDEKDNQEAIAKAITEEMDPEGLYVLGPGTTIKTLAEALKVKKTTLGVDIYYKGKMVGIDADEKSIVDEIETHGGKKNAWIVVSPIGRQGVLFGRGNQQISPAVLKGVNRDHIIVAATRSKVRDLDCGSIKVDTGDKDLDSTFRGYIKVMTDYREWRMVPVD
ncbi:MAG: ATP-NAD kinase family protein [Promethearchaeati archaeon SRVP18_Atabeyarchaeia-1]